ncbi:MAG: cobalamin-dependent protein [Candidatus Thiodiazotropha sp.]
MSELDLLYIHASAMRHEPHYCFIPVGVVGLMNELKAEGFEVLGMNEPMEMALDRSFDLARFIQTHPARAYALDIHWHEHLYGALAVAQTIKRLFPNAWVVAGGITATFFAESLIREHPEIDCVIAGYAEGVLPKLLTSTPGLPRRQVLRARVQPDIDAGDLTDMAFLHHAEHYAQISLHHWHPEWNQRLQWYRNGLGCASDCSFCGGAVSNHRRIFDHSVPRRRSPARIAEDFARLAASGINTVALTQDIANADPIYLERLFDAVTRSGVRIGLYLEPNGLPSPHFLADFANVFLSERSTIVLTPFSGDEKVRRKNGKPYTNEALLHCLSEIEAKGISTLLYFSRNAPFETPLSQLQSSILMRRIARSFGSIQQIVTPLTLDPGSPMHKRPNNYGIQRTLTDLGTYVDRCRYRSQGRPFDAWGYRLADTG